MHPIGDAHTALILHHTTTRERITEAERDRLARSARGYLRLRDRLARLGARDRAPQVTPVRPTRPA